MYFMEGFCSNTAEIWQFVGQIVTILKILVPVILIIIGVIALGKALIDDDDKAIKSAINKLIKKVIIGICIFFVPTIVKGIFSLVTSFSDTEADSQVCINCIVSPNSCK